MSKKQAAVLVHTNTHSIVKTYSSEGFARAAMRKVTYRNGELKYPEDKYSVMTVTEYQQRNTTVVVKSLMTGEDVEIPRSQRGTACDPSMESYWTM